MTEASKPDTPTRVGLSEGLGLAPERARLPNRWRVVCVAGAEPYFERHPDGQWAQREQADAEIDAALAEQRKSLAALCRRLRSLDGDFLARAIEDPASVTWPKKA